MSTPIVWWIFLYLSSFGIVLGGMSVARGVKTLQGVNRRDNEAYYSSFTSDARTYLKTQMPKFRVSSYINIAVGLIVSIGSSILLLVVVKDIVSIS